MFGIVIAGAFPLILVLLDRAWTWNGECSVDGCHYEAVDAGGLCRKHKREQRPPPD